MISNNQYEYVLSVLFVLLFAQTLLHQSVCIILRFLTGILLT